MTSLQWFVGHRSCRDTSFPGPGSLLPAFSSSVCHHPEQGSIINRKWKPQMEFLFLYTCKVKLFHVYNLMDYNIGIVCDVIMVKVNKHILSSPKFPCTHLGGWCICACMYACVCCVHSSKCNCQLQAALYFPDLQQKPFYSVSVSSAFSVTHSGIVQACPCFT